MEKIMKAVLKLIITGLLITSFTISLNASPLTGLATLARRCFAISLFPRDCAQGKMLKALARPYGLDCKYPVFVEQNIAGLAQAINDSTSKKIVFDDSYVKKELEANNPKVLIADLFHENAHLDLNHSSKKIETLRNLEKTFLEDLKILKENEIKMGNIKAQDILAQQPDTNLATKQVNEYFKERAKLLEIDLNKFLLSCKNKIALEPKKVSREHEQEADKSICKHADLCFAQSARFGSIRNLCEDIVLLEQSLRDKMTPSTLASLYGKACNQHVPTYECLEYDRTHPLNGRRAMYFLDMALKAPAQHSYFAHYMKWIKARAELAWNFYLVKKTIKGSR